MLKRWVWFLTLVMLVFRAWAGGSGLNVVVVVNQNSTNSVQLGNEYCAQRDVPPQNLFRMTNWNGGAIAWSQSDFESDLRNPLLAMISASGLTNQIHYVLLSMDIPYRVETGDGANSTTSALFYGFKPNGPPPYPENIPSCSLPDISSNSFAFSELPFELAPPDTAPTNGFLAFMLTDATLAGAQAILSRGVAADSSFPTQAVYLEKTSDAARNVRFLSFDNAIFDSRVRGDASVARIDSDSTSFNRIRGLLTGLATLSLPGDAFVPGSFGDSLTSFAGDLFEITGQTTLLAFLDAGGAASYGTVVEPCNFLQKFPDPLAFFYQIRGFNAAEAYYLSLLNPYQGLLVGEPLCAPFAITGQGTWPGLTNGTVLQGQASLPPALFSSGTTNSSLGQVDLFVDGLFAQTLTNIAPDAGNVLSVTLNGSAVTYTVPTSASLGSVAAGMAEALNSQSNATHVAASATGDRVELQGLDPATTGGQLLLSTSESAGSAPGLSTMLTTARSDFLDTTARGYIVLTVSNSTVQGDWLLVQLTLTNGVQVTVGATNSTPETNVFYLCQALINAINATPALQGVEGVLGGELYPDLLFSQFLVYARAPGWPAAQIKATLTASPGLVILPPGTRSLQDNLFDLRPRNYLFVGAGFTDLPVSLTLDTTRLDDGFHELTLVAYEGTSVRTQTRVARQVQVQNTSLSAVLAPQLDGTNTTLDHLLLVSVKASSNNISAIELFSTGGSLGVISNQSSVVFSVPAHWLGLGVHPLYAVVTDSAGHRFRTATSGIRIAPSFQLAIGGQPLTLSWNAAPGLSYDVLSSTDILSGFQKVANVTASGSTIQWPIPSGSNPAFYRIRLPGN